MTIKPKITVFTSTYNRVDTLPALYESLQRQSCKDFEWIIVDDGSSDNTNTLIKKWQKGEKTFPIIYKKVPNGGKHRAINIGVSLSSAPFFFIVDSDDYALDDAIKDAVAITDSIKADVRFAGAAGTKLLKNGKTIGGDGGLDRGSFVDASNLEREKFHLTGDKQEIYKTSILKKYPFPEIEGETFLSERIVWDKIAREKMILRWFNIPLLVCEYRADGLSKNLDKKNKENPKGFALYVNNFFLNKASFREKLQQVYSYYYLLHDSLSDKEMVSNLKINGAWLKLAKVLYKIKHLSRTAK